MSIELYKVVFNGILKDGVSIDEVQSRLATAFKMSPEKVQRLFTGKPFTIKTDVSLNVAQKYQKALNRLVRYA